MWSILSHRAHGSVSVLAKLRLSGLGGRVRVSVGWWVCRRVRRFACGGRWGPRCPRRVRVSGVCATMLLSWRPLPAAFIRLSYFQPVSHTPLYTTPAGKQGQLPGPSRAIHHITALPPHAFCAPHRRPPLPPDRPQSNPRRCRLHARRLRGCSVLLTSRGRRRLVDFSPLAPQQEHLVSVRVSE